MKRPPWRLELHSQAMLEASNQTGVWENEREDVMWVRWYIHYFYNPHEIPSWNGLRRDHVHRSYEGGGECPVCMEALGGGRVYTTRCGHAFHVKCVRAWKAQGNYSCPMCRGPLAGA